MKAIVVLINILLTSKALGWGPTGHRAVGQIAQDNLDRKAKRNIEKILDGHSLAKASNWPDEIKSDPNQYSHTFRWHYTDWPTSQDNYEPGDESGILVKAIEDNLAILKDSKKSKNEKAFALKFLVHLVGDLHMPLHVGNGLDRGGNNCKVTFHKEETNLHKVWDEDMINFSKLSYTELASFSAVTTKEEKKKVMTGTLLDWARESKLLREDIYPAEVVTDTPGRLPNVKNYCQKELNLPAEQRPALGYEYSYKFMPVVEKRIKEAGLRLAWLLNETL